MKGIISLSGGMDSTTMLYYLYNKGIELKAVSLNYNQNHKKEIELAKLHCDRLNIPHKVIDISFLGEISKGFSSLTSGGDKIPFGHYTEENMKSTVVPFRNGIILSVLAAIAEVEKADKIFYGAHAGDHSIYPDCRPSFEKPMAEAIKNGTYAEVILEAPFINLTKTDIVRIGTELKVPFKCTWSCYVGGERPCLKCGTCVERTEAFYLNNIKDPSLSDDEWEKAVSFYKEIIKNK